MRSRELLMLQCVVYHIRNTRRMLPRPAPRHSPRRGSPCLCSSNQHHPMSLRTRHRSRTFLHSSHTRVEPSHELSEARLSPSHASLPKHSDHTRTTPSCLRVHRDLARTPSHPLHPRTHAHALIQLSHQSDSEKKMQPSRKLVHPSQL